MVLTSFPAFPPGPWPGISVLLLSQQGVPEDIQEALGQSISQAPFVKALAAAERYVVVRNRSAAAVLGALAQVGLSRGVEEHVLLVDSLRHGRSLHPCLVSCRVHLRILACVVSWKTASAVKKAERPRCLKLQNSQTTEAKKFGFYKDKVLVTGPNEFSASLLQQALD